MDLVVLFLLLYLAACGCFLAFALGVKARVNLLGLGVFFWSLVPLIQTLQKL